MASQSLLTPNLRSRTGIINGIPGLSWLFSKVAHLRPRPSLEEILISPTTTHERQDPTKPITVSTLLHDLLAIEDRINDILSHLNDLETDDAVPETPGLIRTGMMTISNLYLIAFGLILDYQYGTWYPSPCVDAWKRPASPLHCKSKSDIEDSRAETDLFEVAVRALEKALYWRSLVLRQIPSDERIPNVYAGGSYLLRKTVDKGLTKLFLPDDSPWLVNGIGQAQDDDSSRGLDVLPYLLEKTQAGLVHLLTRDRQVRHISGSNGRSRKTRRIGLPGKLAEGSQAEEETVDLTADEILARSRYLTDLLGLVHLIRSKETLLALSVPGQVGKTLMDDGKVDERMVGLWMRLKAGLKRVELLHEVARVEQGRRVPIGMQEEQEEEEEACREKEREETLGAIEQTFERILWQIERIPEEDLAGLLFRAEPWLPRASADQVDQVDGASEDDEGTSDDEGSDDGEEATQSYIDNRAGRVRATHTDPPSRPLLERLFRIYNRYQEYRYALYLAQPIVVRVKSEPAGQLVSGQAGSGKRKLSRFREDGKLGAVWRRVMWRVSKIVGMDKMIDLGLDEDQAEEWQSVYYPLDPGSDTPTGSGDLTTPKGSPSRSERGKAESTPRNRRAIAGMSVSPSKRPDAHQMGKRRKVDQEHGRQHLAGLVSSSPK